jgi:uncharacterized protein (TIGR02266 family)
VWEKKQVLVICRSAAGQMYLGVLMNRIWYSPILAKTPEEGIRIIQSASVSSILFDGDLPATELNSSIRQLRSDPSTGKLPLVVFLSESSPELNEKLLASGCTAILTKPLDLAIMFEVLARLSGQPRSTPRVPIKVSVEIAEGTPERTLIGTNISEGGVYLRTFEPLPEGTLLHIKFMLPHDTVPIDIAADVVWTHPLGIHLDSEPGMGLRFRDLPADTQQRIRHFIQWELMGDLEWETNI